MSCSLQRHPPPTHTHKINKIHLDSFFLSFSNLPSSSHNSTEFDDPTLIQNIEKDHVRLFSFFLLSQLSWRLLLITTFTLFARGRSAYITSDLRVLDDDGGVPYGGSREGGRPDHLPGLVPWRRSTGQRSQRAGLCLHCQDPWFSHHWSCKCVTAHVSGVAATFWTGADIFLWVSDGGREELWATECAGVFQVSLKLMFFLTSDKMLIWDCFGLRLNKIVFTVTVNGCLWWSGHPMGSSGCTAKERCVYPIISKFRC